MKRLFILFLLILKIFNATSNSVPCGEVRDDYWSSLVGTVKTCFVINTTSISAKGAQMSEKIVEDSGIDFFDNDKIKFLPDKVAENFPNLIGYLIHRCAIKEISRGNFKNLSKLRYLWLGYNQIEKITSDTFQDLVKLQQIYLVNNKLKQINGNAFNNLDNLHQVWFNPNPCIKEDFGYKKTLDGFKDIVTKKCGFRE